MSYEAALGRLCGVSEGMLKNRNGTDNLGNHGNLMFLPFLIIDLTQRSDKVYLSDKVLRVLIIDPYNGTYPTRYTTSIGKSRYTTYHGSP